MKITLSLDEFKVMYNFIGKLTEQDEDRIYNWGGRCKSNAFLVYEGMLNYNLYNELSEVNEVEVRLSITEMGRFIEWFGYIDRTIFNLVCIKNELSCNDDDYMNMYNAYKRIINQYRVERGK